MGRFGGRRPQMRDGTVVGEELLESSGEPEAGKGNAYPYPTPQDAARAKRIVALVDRLLKDEKDGERRKLLRDMRGIAVQATQAYPAPPVADEESASGLSPDRIREVRETLRRVTRALGLDDAKSARIPDLGREVNELQKRIDRFTGHAPEGDGDGKVSWKGMV
jgi:hypothetical protein